MRGRVQAPPGIDEEAVFARALGEPGVRTYVEGKTVRKRIFVPDKLLNVVAS